MNPHRKIVNDPRPQVLIVEDDLTTLELMKEVLSSFNLIVVCESDSEKASARIGIEKFDGIFLDLMMPKLTGFQLAREIRASRLNRNTTIIIVAATDDKKTMEEAFRAGGSFFLSKPIDRRRLTTLLNSTRGTMVESRRRLRRLPMSTAVSGNVHGTAISVQCADLSEQGMLVGSNPALMIGATFNLSFSLPGQMSTISAPGLVVRFDDAGRVGLQFGPIREVDRQRIRLYLDENYPIDREIGSMATASLSR